MVDPAPPRRRAVALVAAGALSAGLVVAVAPAAQAAELIPGGDFSDGHGAFWASGNLTIDSSGGALCVDVPGGTANPWDAIVGHDGLDIRAGETYELTVVASAVAESGQAKAVRTLVQQPTEPWGTALERLPAVGPEPETLSWTFTPTEAIPDGQLAFQIGGSAEPWRFCLDLVSLQDGAEEEDYVPDTGPRVRVNQVGYATHGPKHATLVTDATSPVRWTLRQDGRSVSTGLSVPRGHDASAGASVHTLDLSHVRSAGTGFTLSADGETSHPFAIGDGLYDDLRVDSLSFFYPQRSGTPILGEVAGEAYARAAGHVDVAPNTGDGAVPCLPAGAATTSDGVDLYDGWTCDYTLDVRGGWYDAGDHGKYVVNGGISVAQLLGTYERSLTARSARDGALGDGTLRVPEHGNDVPDVLDEARWQLEWMLRMQVPAGESLAGMVHHKIHDAQWTGIPLMPADDPQPRYLHRPSTAATLNLAAVAAQGARLLAPHDGEFATELLAAAEVAFAAALSTPDLYAPNTNVLPNPGGGPYDDTEVEDELYWAAAELYLTTGGQQYLDHVLANAYHLGGSKEAFPVIGFDWKDVAALARINLATVPSLVPQRQAVRASVVEAAERLVAVQAGQPFGHPYAGVDGRYEWGSNGKVLNNLAVLAVAFDVTGNPRYSHALLAGTDYLLGRNALNLSYVTGYGTAHVRNQHSRWYANQANPALPNPPAGTVSGGPNSDVPDPVSGPLLAGCAPQRCFVDDIGAWGVNELTINWNAALAFVASALADLGDGAAVAPFPDVPLGHPFLLDVQWLVDEGLATGYADGTFRPSTRISRQAMAAFLYRAAGSPAFSPPAMSPFRDVRTTDPFYREIAWMAAEGLAEGYPDGTFRSGAPISRQAMAAFLHRSHGAPQVTGSAGYADVPADHPFHDEITWLTRVQVATGYPDGTFQPSRPVSRQAMAAFLHRSTVLPVAGVVAPA